MPHANGIQLHLQQLTTPTSINGKKLAFKEHCTDLVRLNVIQTFGGVYMDTDVLFIWSLRPLMCDDITLGEESNLALPMSLLIAVPNTTFVNLLLKEYDTNYNRESWGYNAVVLPSVLYRIYPDLIHVEPESINHPNYGRGEVEKIFGPLEREGGLDWTKNFVVHLWNKVTADVFTETPENIRKMNSACGQMARQVYYGTTDFV